DLGLLAILQICVLPLAVSTQPGFRVQVVAVRIEQMQDGNGPVNSRLPNRCGTCHVGEEEATIGQPTLAARVGVYIVDANLLRCRHPVHLTCRSERSPCLRCAHSPPDTTPAS